MSESHNPVRNATSLMIFSSLGYFAVRASLFIDDCSSKQKLVAALAEKVMKTSSSIFRSMVQGLPNLNEYFLSLAYHREFQA